MFKLVISDDEGKTIIVPLVRDLVTVGRQDGNTIRLTERNVSRQHARLVKAEHTYRVEDLESYNGVLLNGTRIAKQADLKDGDRVGIGDYVIALRADPDAVGVSPPVTRTSAPPGQAGSPARLVMVSAPAPGAEFSIAKPVVRIGRLEELDLCISHRSISREHARVLQKDGSFEVEDLNSANGVRVNGSTVKKALLKSGDVVELGQVRFRFVKQGEAYVFDPSEEEAAASGLPDASLRPQKRTIAAIAVSAAVVGGVLAFMDDARPKPPLVAEPVAAPVAAPATPAQEDNSQQQKLAAALEACRTALAAERFAEATQSAQTGLALGGDAPALVELRECKRLADDAVRAIESFELGKAALAQGKLEDAYLLFAGLPDAYQTRAEVVQAGQRLAIARLSEARAQLRAEPEGAERIADAVLGMRGLAPAMMEDAQRLKASASKLTAAKRARAEASGESAHDRAAPPPDGEAAAETPSQVARNCLARGDQRCAVRALEGHAESSQELALLIETYRALGDVKKAVKHMESFVERFPTARQTPQYRQFVTKYE